MFLDQSRPGGPGTGARAASGRSLGDMIQQCMDGLPLNFRVWRAWHENRDNRMLGTHPGLGSVMNAPRPGGGGPGGRPGADTVAVSSIQVSKVYVWYSVLVIMIVQARPVGPGGDSVST